MKISTITRCAIIAAIYVVVSLIFAPISFGAVQVRVSEALTLLVVLCPEAVAGVTIGCFIANLIASAPIDMVVGTAATLVAAICSRKMRNVRWKAFAKPKGLAVAASLPPVIFNAVIVGIELTILYFPKNSALSVYAINMLSVGVGQIISCCILGLMLLWIIERSPHLAKLFGRNSV